MKRAVDFDGTLAFYDGCTGPGDLGKPIQMMVDRVRKWLEQGDEVVVLTARVHPSKGLDAEIAEVAIRDWCLEVFGRELEVTCMKDPMMCEIWDDKAVRVYENTGLVSTQQDIISADTEADTDGIGEFLGD